MAKMIDRFSFNSKVVSYLSILVFSTFIVLNSLFLSSCNDQPTSMGFPIDTLTIYSISDTSLITGTSSDYSRISHFQADEFQIGKHDDYQAVSFLRYGLGKDTIYGYFTEQNILSAKLVLQPKRSTFGDSLGNLNFAIYPLKKAFLDSTRWTHIFDNAGNTDWFDNQEVGSFDGKLTLKDTMDQISVDISKTMLVDWFKLASMKDTTNSYSYSFAIKAKGATNGIYSFKSTSTNTSLSYNPVIHVIFKDSTGKTDSVDLKMAYNSTFMNGKFDKDEKYLTIQSGIAVRSQIFFDVTKIPAYASIVKSQLELYIDDSKTVVGNLKADSLISAIETKSIASTGLSVFPFTAKRESTSSSKYIFPSITSAIETWNRSGGVGSITLAAMRNASEDNEYRYLDKYVFHSSKALDTSKRPKLVIFYSKRPKV